MHIGFCERLHEVIFWYLQLWSFFIYNLSISKKTKQKHKQNIFSKVKVSIHKHQRSKFCFSGLEQFCKAIFPAISSCFLLRIYPVSIPRVRKIYFIFLGFNLIIISSFLEVHILKNMKIIKFCSSLAYSLLVAYLYLLFFCSQLSQTFTGPFLL